MSSPLKIAVLALTYDKVEHATGLWQIIRNIWSQTDELKDVTLYHVFNGKTSWYPNKTHEDVLIRRENLGHVEGALDIMNTGINAILQSGIEYDFIIVCSSDAWITQPKPLAHILSTMKAQDQMLLVSRWNHHYLWGSEWFALTPKLAQRTFPLPSHTSTSDQVLLKLGSTLHALFPLFQAPLLEKTLTNGLKKGLSSVKNDYKNLVRFLPHREYVWFHNRYFTKELGYLSHHNLEQKRTRMHPDHFPSF